MATGVRDYSTDRWMRHPEIFPDFPQGTAGIFRGSSENLDVSFSFLLSCHTKSFPSQSI